MSQAATAHAVVEPAETPLTPDSWGKLGMWIFLVGELLPQRRQLILAGRQFLVLRLDHAVVPIVIALSSPPDGC